MRRWPALMRSPCVSPARFRPCRPCGRPPRRPPVLQLRAGRVRGHGGARQGAHRRRRHHPGGAVAALPRVRRRRALRVYRALRAINPSPYMFYLDLGDAQLVGASPEMLVRVEDGKIDHQPIAGTRRARRDPSEDAALDDELLADPKERAEHVMLLDLGAQRRRPRRGPARCACPRSCDIERYSHVMHLVSHVTGRLRAGLTALRRLARLLPGRHAVAARPKIRAMQIIAELERDRRGVLRRRGRLLRPRRQPRHGDHASARS